MALGFTKVRIYHLLTWCMTLTHPEALILDPLQYGKEIWPRNFLPFCPASHNNPIHYTMYCDTACREGKRGSPPNHKAEIAKKLMLILTHFKII